MLHECLGCDLIIVSGFLTRVYPFSNGMGFCAVPTADDVSTGEIDCYNFVACLCSFPRFAETISHGYFSAGRATTIDLRGCSKRNNCYAKSV